MYAIAGTDALRPSEPGSGVRELPLRWIATGELAALASDVPPREVLSHPSVSDVLAFERAIAAAHARCDLLPVRYGCVIDGEEQLGSLLRERQQRHLEDLRRVAGCVEMGVRIGLAPLPPEAAGPPRTPAHTGADYLRARQAHYARLVQDQARMQEASAHLQSTFAELFREAQALPAASPSPEGGLTVAFLVPRGAVDAFRARFASFKQTAAGKATLLGPWPPFSFSAASPEPVIDDQTRGG